MSLADRLGTKARKLKSHVHALYRGMHDPRVPWYVKALTLLVIAYVVSPIDIIPDFIPVIGLLDEVILVPLALSLIVRLMPQEVMQDYQSGEYLVESRGLKITGALVVLLVWLGLIWLGYVWWRS